MFSFLVERLVKGEPVPVGCADSVSNAMLLLKGHAGVIHTKNDRVLLVVSEFND